MMMTSRSFFRKFSLAVVRFMALTLNATSRSAKMRKTSELVNQWLAENDEDKIVIFSQFVSFINLVKDHLAEQDIRCFTYTGAMSKADRDETIANFTNPKNPTRVILISTKAGGVGLNLTIGNLFFWFFLLLPCC
jgi:SNF2 family DNA or RNA helicase